MQQIINSFNKCFSPLKSSKVLVAFFLELFLFAVVSFVLYGIFGLFFSSFLLLPVSIVIALIALLAFPIIVSGFLFYLKGFFENKKLSFQKSLSSALPFIKRTFLISLIALIIVGALIGLSFFYYSTVMPSLALAQLSFFTVVLPIFVLFFVFLLVFPFLYLLLPVLLFEKKGVIQTIKSCCNAWKKNFKQNLALIVLFYVIIATIGWLISSYCPTSMASPLIMFLMLPFFIMLPVPMCMGFYDSSLVLFTGGLGVIFVIIAMVSMQALMLQLYYNNKKFLK
ncbi:MAG: hypothetical protein ABH821_05490 [archaeon]